MFYVDKSLIWLNGRSILDVCQPFVLICVFKGHLSYVCVDRSVALLSEWVWCVQWRYFKSLPLPLWLLSNIQILCEFAHLSMCSTSEFPQCERERVCVCDYDVLACVCAVNLKGFPVLTAFCFSWICSLVGVQVMCTVWVDHLLWTTLSVILRVALSKANHTWGLCIWG